MHYTMESNKCLFCNSDTKNPKFCSSSCAAKHNNKHAPKRAKTKKCECGTLILSSRTFCSDCHKSTLYEWKTKTLADIQGKATYQVSALIRNIARQVFRRSDKPKCCAVCGYDKHVEVCHIRAIKEFPLNATIGEINCESNLVGLCPNHHWEFDNGFLGTSF